MTERFVTFGRTYDGYDLGAIIWSRSPATEEVIAKYIECSTPKFRESTECPSINYELQPVITTIANSAPEESDVIVATAVWTKWFHAWMTPSTEFPESMIDIIAGLLAEQRARLMSGQDDKI